MDIKELTRESVQFVEGWDRSGGKSFNVWLMVDDSCVQLPTDLYEEYAKVDKFPPVWTPFDEDLKAGNRPPKNAMVTFKPSYDKYIHVCENLAMKMAVQLDIPTSYNQIVRFNAEKFPEIIGNIGSKHAINNIQPYGLISIDFLTGCEKLVEFADLSRSQSSIVKSQSSQVEQWIKYVDEIAKKYIKNKDSDEVERQISKINSRIARSVLFRELIGDADFTDRNSGLVVNEEEGYVRYAPNFDYGEAFNGLVKEKLTEYSLLQNLGNNQLQQQNIEMLRKYKPGYIEKMAEERKNRSVKELGYKYASKESKENIEYIISNFPTEASEFVSNLQHARENRLIEKMAEDCNTNCKLLSKEECGMFAEYINHRADFLHIEITNQINEHSLQMGM